jgi:DHA1 family bicyclomycin/chloramphenicol resistance-like MFS transporter
MGLLTTPLLRGRQQAPFLLLVALTACGTLGMHIVIPALPATARAMGISIGTVQLTITLYLVGLAVGQLLYGPLSDRFGRRPVLLVAMTLFTLASAAAASAPNPTILIGARILQSIGGCAGLVLGRAAVRDGATQDKAAGQLALLTVTMSMVPAIAPAIGGYVTAFVSWRASYFLLVGIGAATLLATVLLLPETNYGSSRRAPLSFGRGYSRLLLSPVFLGFAVPGAFTTTAFYAFMAAAPFIFENHLHQGAQDVGLYYLILMVGVAVGGVLANRLSHRVTLRNGLRIANATAILGASCFMRGDGAPDGLRGGRFGSAVHGRRGHGEPLRSGGIGQCQSAGHWRGVRTLWLHPDGLRHGLHHRGGKLEPRFSIPGRGRAAGIRRRRAIGVGAGRPARLRLRSTRRLLPTGCSGRSRLPPCRYRCRRRAC